MKKIYINRWLGFSIILIVGIGATALIMHTIATINAQYLSYVTLVGN